MPSTSPTPARSRRLAAIVLLALTALAYLPSLGNGFVWDDDTSVTANRLIHEPGGLARLWFSARNPDYWPATETTLWAEWRLWGMNPAGYHATNLALHLAEVLLIWLLLERLRVPGAWLGALLFGLHPVNVESVAWITQRKNLMAMLFYLASIGCFLRADEPPPDRRRGGAGWFALSLLAFALAMLSKGSVAILPLVLAGLVAARRRFEARDALRLLPYLAIAGVFTLVDLKFQANQLGALEVIRRAGPLERLLGAAAAVWFYLGKALLPLRLTFVYPQWRIDASSPAWYLPLVAALAATAWLCRSRRLRPVRLAWLYFCAALLPALGFTDVYFMKFSLVADHYQHLALIGVAALGGAGWAAWRRRSRAADAAAALVAGALLALTWRQCLLYRDSGRLFTDVLSRNPGSAMAHNNLGVVIAERRDLSGALAQFQEALRLEPGYAEAERNLGLTLARQGRPADALPHYRAALRLRPNYPDAEDDLGNALLALERPAEAAGHFERSLRLNPDNPEAEGNLGVALAQQGRSAQAIAHLEAAVRLDPGNAALRQNLAAVRAGP
ncbi:MAG TPA: tetratricopeptide repeat protein [Opitutaceae bacterium]|nr:tetratricopeptide repeat protein [Opitutaceae bacterium]